MANEVSNSTNVGGHELPEDLEKQSNSKRSSAQDQQGSDDDQPQLNIVVVEGEPKEVPSSPKKGCLSRSTSSHEQCR